MLAIFTARLNPSSVMGQSRRARLIWLVWFLGILGMTGVLAFLLLYSGPKLPIIAWLIFGLGIGAILYRPHFGVYLALIFSLMGDGILIPWYPFVKNFSSAESIFFIHNSLIISPLEVYLLVTLVSWLGRAAMERKFKFYTGPLFWPAMLFTGFIIFGLAYGLSRGGIVNVALWEARAIFYLPVMLVLVSNLITTRQRVNILLWVAMLAILFVGIYGTIDYFTNLKDASVNVDWLIEHATAVRMNSLFIFVIAVWMYKASPNKRYILPTDGAVCDFDLPFRGKKSSIPDPGNCTRLYGDHPVQRKQAPLLDDHPSCCPSIRGVFGCILEQHEYAWSPSQCSQIDDLFKSSQLRRSAFEHLPDD